MRGVRRREKRPRTVEAEQSKAEAEQRQNRSGRLGMARHRTMQHGATQHDTARHSNAQSTD
eukprot:12564405-Alexandrium_andersonii.AAC.1